MPSPIKIAERFRPYSRLPGQRYLLPGSSCCLQVFPGLLKVIDLSLQGQQAIAEVKLDVYGPLEQFTVMVDLESLSILVWGKASNGFLRYRIRSEKEGIRFTLEKCPDDKLSVCVRSAEWTCLFQETCLSHDACFEIVKKESFILHRGGGGIPFAGHCEEKKVPFLERLSLGNHKAQDWEMICRRQNLSEILPLWYAVAQSASSALAMQGLQMQHGGVFALFDECNAAIESKNKPLLCKQLMHLFQGGFQSFFVPQMEDHFHLGFLLPPFDADIPCSPLMLLQKSAELIRRIFIEVRGKDLYLLPVLPPEFYCGRFLGVACGAFGILDMEWSKKKMRRAVLRIKQNGVMMVHFPKSVQSYRLRKGDKDPGQIFKNGEAIEGLAGESLYFDRFMQ